MDLTPLLFHFPGSAPIHCLVPLRALPAKSRFSGNLSYDVNDKREDVLERRNALLSFAAPFNLKKIIDIHQVHGSTILFDPKDNQIPSFEGDGIATQEKGLGLFIKTADCQAILIASEDPLAIMAIHVGWRANRCNFIGKAIEEFCTHYALSPSRLFALRTPSLSPQNAEFIHFEEEWGSDFLSFFSLSTQTMDLWALSRFQLLEAGLQKERIFSLDLCTKSNPSCFSYRRKDAGRLGGIIWIG